MHPQVADVTRRIAARGAAAVSSLPEPADLDEGCSRCPLLS